jgi:hypothetical protein
MSRFASRSAIHSGVTLAREPAFPARHAAFLDRGPVERYTGPIP